MSPTSSPLTPIGGGRLEPLALKSNCFLVFLCCLPFLSFFPSVFLPVCLSVLISFCRSFFLFPSVCLSVFISLSFSFSCLPFFSFVLSFCLSICLYFFCRSFVASLPPSHLCLGTPHPPIRPLEYPRPSIHVMVTRVAKEDKSSKGRQE